MSAVRAVVWRVLEEVPADLAEAALFGSRARGEARPESDLDLLLVFRLLPPDREPQASIAERIALDVARETRVPVTVWSVSLPDLERGRRTPMLVDALADAVPIWSWPEALAPISFTPEDALHCCRSLLDRVEEGSAEFAALLSRQDLAAAVRRARDDVIRLCTALLLLRGITRPRRGEVIDVALEVEFAAGPAPPPVVRALRWARDSFGVDGRDDDLSPPPPADGLPATAGAIDYLRGRVTRSAQRLRADIEGGTLLR